MLHFHWAGHFAKLLTGIPLSLGFRRSSARVCCLALALAVLPLVPTNSCKADLLPFTLSSDHPVTLGINGTLTYDLATGQFHSETDLLTYSANFLPNGFVFYSSGRTVIDLFVDTAGNRLPGGSGLTMTGELDLDEDGIDDVSGDAISPLLFGRVLAFGAEPAGPPTRVFNGLWEIEGGALTGPIALSGGGSVFGGFPQGTEPPGGFFLFAENASNGTLGDFTADFSSDSVKDNVGVPVPEPGSMALMLVGAALVGTIVRIRNRSARSGRPVQSIA